LSNRVNTIAFSSRRNTLIILKSATFNLAINMSTENLLSEWKIRRRNS